MKRTITILAFAAAVPGLAGCGSQSEGNAVLDQGNLQPTSENVLVNGVENVSEPMEPATVNTADAPPPPAAPPVKADTDSGPDEERRAPPPKAPRPQPEPDPHAGHDMGNMSNMSHD